MTPSEFVETLRRLDFESTFNPYSDHCSIYDHKDAPRRRCEALLSILKAAATSEIDSLWIGRDLGHRGGRRTGLALTDDVHLAAHAKRWGARIERSTKGDAMAERTAAVIWGVLVQIDVSVFLWNVFPLHPHEAENPFSNRAHNAYERRIGEDLLCRLIFLLKPRRLVPIGNNAASTARRLCANEEVIQVRHPSYGGQNKFLRQTHELYNLH